MTLNRLKWMATGILILCLALAAAHEHVKNRQLAGTLEHSAAVIAGSAGQISSVLLELKKDAPLREDSIDELQMTLTYLSLILTSNELNVYALDRNSFDALCMLLSNSDTLFPLSRTAGLDGPVNKLLNRRLGRLQADVQARSTQIALLTGAPRDCVTKQTP